MNYGLQMAQIVHGAIEFALNNPHLTRMWHDISNYVAVLAVENEEQLFKLIMRAEMRGVKCAIFREPDQNDAITAVVLEPSLDSRKISSHIALAGRGG